MDTDFSLPRAGPKGEDIFVHATLGVHGKQSVSAEVVLGYCSEDQIQAPGQPSKMNFEHHKVHMGVDGAPEHTWSKRKPPHRVLRRACAAMIMILTPEYPHQATSLMRKSRRTPSSCG